MSWLLTFACFLFFPPDFDGCRVRKKCRRVQQPQKDLFFIAFCPFSLSSPFQKIISRSSLFSPDRPANSWRSCLNENSLSTRHKSDQGLILQSRSFLFRRKKGVFFYRLNHTWVYIHVTAFSRLKKKRVALKKIPSLRPCWGRRLGVLAWLLGVHVCPRQGTEAKRVIPITKRGRKLFPLNYTCYFLSFSATGFPTIKPVLDQTWKLVINRSF